MTDILSDESAMNLAIGLAASQRIILEALFEAGVLDREKIVQAFHAKAKDLIEVHMRDDAANVIRLIHRELEKPGG